MTQQKQKFQTIPGMHDILPSEIKTWQFLENKARTIFECYGFTEIRTPLLEDAQLFERGIGSETQVVQKEMYTFTDRGGDVVTLRPEGTASVVRAYIQHTLQRDNPQLKLYYMGPMFRYERPQKGRLRQFHQIGVEFLGEDSALADAEVVIMLDRFFQSLGLGGRYTLQINSLGTQSERLPFIKKLQSYLQQRQHALCEQCQKRLVTNPMRVFDCKNQSCQNEFVDAPLLINELEPSSRQHFDIFCEELQRAGVVFEINPRIVRGLDYYERTAFEFTSTQLGSQSAFAGGGRYNQLVEELGGVVTPAVGFAIGCERVVLLLQSLQQNASEAPRTPGCFFVSFDENSLKKARELTQLLRDHHIPAETPFLLKSLKSQMKRADKSGLAYAGLLGDAELKQSQVLLKDLVTGVSQNVAFDDILPFFSHKNSQK